MIRRCDQTLLKWIGDILLLNSDQCYILLGLSQGASMTEIRNAYRRLVLEYHPDKNISSKDGIKFKLITEAYQTLRIKNMSAGRNSVYQNEATGDHICKKIKSWNFYLNVFDDVIDYTRKIKYVKTICSYLLKYKPIFIACCGSIQKHATNSICHLITFSYAHVDSFISHTQYRRMTQSLLKYLGIHS